MAKKIEKNPLKKTEAETGEKVLGMASQILGEAKSVIDGAGQAAINSDMQDDPENQAADQMLQGTEKVGKTAANTVKKIAQSQKKKEKQEIREQSFDRSSQRSQPEEQNAESANVREENTPSDLNLKNETVEQTLDIKDQDSLTLHDSDSIQAYRDTVRANTTNRIPKATNSSGKPDEGNGGLQIRFSADDSDLNIKKTQNNLNTNDDDTLMSRTPSDIQVKNQTVQLNTLDTAPAKTGTGSGFELRQESNEFTGKIDINDNTEINAIREYAQNQQQKIRPAKRQEPEIREKPASREVPRTSKETADNRMSIKTKEPVSSDLQIGHASPLQVPGGGLQTESASLQIQGSQQALKTVGTEAGKSSIQAAGQAGATAASGAATAGATVAAEAAKKIGDKIKDTIIEAATKMRSEDKSVLSIGVVLLFVPLIVMTMMAAAVLGGGGGSASNQGLSEGVIALMPKIVAACQRHNIPEYAPLVAAVMMQESGGNVELVNGDVMQCAEGMGYPVWTPVPVDESIDFGTQLIATYLHQAGSTGPADLPAISLALQSYNFGGGYLTWALENYGGYSKENAAIFSAQQAAAMGWSGYGDMDYVDHVLRYYVVNGGSGNLVNDSAIQNGYFAYPLPGHPWHTYAGHEGIDIAWDGCEGQPVYAAQAGIVSYSYGSWSPADGTSGMASYGNAVCIRHSNGWESRYGHMSSIVVASGQQVVQGQLIGYIGNTGNSFGAHLHIALYDPSGSPYSGSTPWAELAWPQHKG